MIVLKISVILLIWPLTCYCQDNETTTTDMMELTTMPGNETDLAGPTCYFCQNCASNNLANAENITCQVGEACRTQYSVRSQGGLNALVKGCKSQCLVPDTNFPAGSGRTYCCFEDFCNEGLVFRAPPAAEVETMTTTATPATTMQTTAMVTSAGLECYSCRNCRNNRLANENKIMCEVGEFCFSQYAAARGRAIVVKKCVPTCNFPGVNFRAGTGRKYCCDTDLCNEELVFR